MADRDAGLEDGSDVATSQATQPATRSWKRQGLTPPESIQGEHCPVTLPFQPSNTTDFRFLASRTVREQMSMVVSHQICGHLSSQLQETKTPSSIGCANQGALGEGLAQTLLCSQDFCIWGLSRKRWKETSWHRQHTHSHDSHFLVKQHSRLISVQHSYIFFCLKERLFL